MIINFLNKIINYKYYYFLFSEEDISESLFNIPSEFKIFNGRDVTDRMGEGYIIEIRPILKPWFLWYI